MSVGHNEAPKDFLELAKTLALGGFRISLLKHQEQKTHVLIKSIQESLDKSRSSRQQPPRVVEHEDRGLLAWVFSGPQEDEPKEQVADYSAPKGLPKKELGKLKQKKAGLDLTASTINRKIAEVQRDRAAAESLLRRIAREAVFQASEAKTAMKRAVSTLAEQVDPQGTECALTLGKLWLRTPCFFLENHLVGRTPGSTESPTSMRKHEKLPPLDFDPSTVEPWQIYEKVDILVDKAALQDEQAIEQLLTMLVDERMHQQQRHQIMRSVHDKANYLAQHDQEKSNDTGFRSAMVANWPKQGRSAPNFQVYGMVASIIQEQVDEYVQVPDDDASSDAGRTSLARSSSRSRSKQPREERKASKDPTDRFLRVLDSNFLEVQMKDSWLHLTAQVFEVLLKLTATGFEQYQQEVLVLYGYPDIPEVKWQEPHWFLRSRAALRICELAAEGNYMARELICGKLLHESEHWMVRTIVVEEVCRMLGRMAPEESCFREYLDELTRVLFTFPPVPSHKTRGQRELEMHNKGLINAQKSAESTLSRELVFYPAELRFLILQDLKQRCMQREEDAKRQVMDRILQAVGGMPARTLGH